MTAQDLIVLALRDLGVLAVNESWSTLSAADQTLTVQTLQGFIDSLNAQRLAVFTLGRSVYPLAASGYGVQATYTLGPGGNFNGQRPNEVYRAGLILTNANPQFEKKLRILTDAEWADTRAKTITSTIPTAIYFDGSYPLCNVNLWPVPSDPGLQVALYIPQFLTNSDAAGDTVLSYPPGYQEMLEYGLVPRLAVKFSKAVTADMIAAARNSFAIVTANNAPRLKMRMDPAGRGGTAAGYNILDDGYGDRS